MASRLYERTGETRGHRRRRRALEVGRGTLAPAGGAGGARQEHAGGVRRRASLGSAAHASWLARARHLASAAPFEVLRRLLGPAVEEAGGVDALKGAARFADPAVHSGRRPVPGRRLRVPVAVAWLAERAPLVLADRRRPLGRRRVAARAARRPGRDLGAARGDARAGEPSGREPRGPAAAWPRWPRSPTARCSPRRRSSREAVAAVVTDTPRASRRTTLFVDECLKVSRRQRLLPARAAAPLPRPTSGPTGRRSSRNGTLSLAPDGRRGGWASSAPDAAALAQAAAVLGDGCSLHLAAELAELDEAVARPRGRPARGRPACFTHGDPVEFVHPLLRAAVEADAARRGVGRAARPGRAPALVDRRGARAPSPSTSSPHPDPATPQVSAYLCEQGQAALEAGSVAVATRCCGGRSTSRPRPTSATGILVAPRAARSTALGARRRPGAPRDRHGVRRPGGGAARPPASCSTCSSTPAGSPRWAGSTTRALALRPYGDHRGRGASCAPQLLVNVVMSVDAGLGELPPELAGDRAATSLLDRARRRPLPAGQRRDLRAHHAARHDRAARGQPASSRRELCPSRRGRLHGVGRPGSASRPRRSSPTTSSSEADAILDRVAPAVARLAGVRPDAPGRARPSPDRSWPGARGRSRTSWRPSTLAEELHDATRDVVGYDGSHRFIRGRIALEQRGLRRGGEHAERAHRRGPGLPGARRAAGRRRRAGRSEMLDELGALRRARRHPLRRSRSSSSRTWSPATPTSMLGDRDTGGRRGAARARRSGVATGRAAGSPRPCAGARPSCPRARASVLLEEAADAGGGDAAPTRAGPGARVVRRRAGPRRSRRRGPRRAVPRRRPGQ